MRYFLHDWQGKGKMLNEALYKNGWQPVANMRRANVFFIDRDFGADVGQPAPRWRFAYRMRKPIILIPHAAHPAWWYDGVFKEWEGIACHVVPAKGHKEIMEYTGYKTPVETVGWFFSEVLPYKEPEKIETVLFGPVHPYRSGFLIKEFKEWNQRAHDMLAKWARENGKHLIVRHIHELVKNGIEPVEGVEYVSGNTHIDTSREQMMAADVVVGYQSFMYIALARGKTTLGFGTGLPPMYGGTNRMKVYRPARWDEYKDRYKNPIDLFDFDNAGDAIMAALKAKEVMQKYRENYIGEPFDAKRFLKVAEKYAQYKCS